MRLRLSALVVALLLLTLPVRAVGTMTWLFTAPAPVSSVTAALTAGVNITNTAPYSGNPASVVDGAGGTVRTVSFRYGRTGGAALVDHMVSSFGSSAYDGYYEVDVTLVPAGPIVARVYMGPNPGAPEQLDVNYFSTGSAQSCFLASCGTVVGTIVAVPNTVYLGWQAVWDDGSVDTFNFVIPGSGGGGGQHHHLTVLRVL